MWTVLVGSRRSLKQSAMRSNRRRQRACSRSNRTPASDVISTPSKAANTSRLPKSEKRILKTPCFIKAHPNQHEYTDCKKRIGIPPDPGEKCGYNSPRGPIAIDAATRDIVQNQYVHRIVKEGGRLKVTVIDVVEQVGNPCIELKVGRCGN